jgi:hypothetical protein
MVVPEPRCPFCNTVGISQVEAQPIGPILLIFCKNCGAIHGAIPNPKPPEDVLSSPNRAPVSLPLKPKPAPIPAPAPTPGQMTPERMAAMAPLMVSPGSTNYRVIRPLTDEEAKGE